MSEKIVIVTGFGPFRKVTDNPSSQIVDELEKEGIQGVKLNLNKISVAYDEVSRKVPELWEQHKPDLVVHIGVHDVAKVIKFEQQAFAEGYVENDVNGCTPEGNKTGCCRIESLLQSDIDCLKLAEEVSKRCKNIAGEQKLKILKSEDPGRYLCGFSYFLSLHQDKSKSLFIHVPPFDDECTKEAVTQVIRETIKCILQI